MGLNKGDKIALGARSPTAEEKAARKMHKLELMDLLLVLTKQPVKVLKELYNDEKTTAKEMMAIRLIMQAVGGDRDIQAAKLILDRTDGPVAQKVELSGNLYDFQGMSKEEKMELLNELRKQRSGTLRP